MIDYSEIPDQDLAKRMTRYVERINALAAEILRYMNRTDCSVEQKILIQEEYTALKAEIKKESHDIQIQSNEHCRDTDAFRCYRYGITEAAAWGLKRPTNANIDFSFYSAIEEAHYKLTKFMPIEEWEALLSRSQSE